MVAVSFDFTGCGLSHGEFVTLGYKEVHDLECIVKKIKSLDYINK